DVNRECPPAETKMSIGIIHWDEPQVGEEYPQIAPIAQITLRRCCSRDRRSRRGITKGRNPSPPTVWLRSKGGDFQKADASSLCQYDGIIVALSSEPVEDILLK